MTTDMTDSDKLRLLADWFDKTDPSLDKEVQIDLRRIADNIDDNLIVNELYKCSFIAPEGYASCKYITGKILCSYTKECPHKQLLCK